MNVVHNRILESIDVKKKILDNPLLLKHIEDVAADIVKCFKANGSVYFCGNGGSAADAQHLAAELSGRFYYDRQPLSSDALHCNTSFLTAVANDYSYEETYARLITGIGRPGDMLIGISTSGNSKNIVRAIERAKEMNIGTVALTGDAGNKMQEIADSSICVPSKDTPRIQESHIMIGHIICEIVEATLFPREK